MENTAVEDDKISEASLSKEERIALENSIQILGPRDQEDADHDIHNGVCIIFNIIKNNKYIRVIN